MGIDLAAILAGVLATIGGLLIAFLKGKKSERNRQDSEDLEAVEEAREVERGVNSESNPARRLRDKWRR